MGKRRMDDSQMENTRTDSAGAAGSWPSVLVTTQDPAVDAALAAVRDVPAMPTTEHLAVYTALHDGLLAQLNVDLSEER